MKQYFSRINKDNRLLNLIIYFICIFIISIFYNVVYVKNNIVTGGLSGTAILIQALFKIETTIFIDISTAILLIASLLLLGKKKTTKHLLGGISYPLMITLTSPLKNYITISASKLFLVVCISIIVQGVCTGIVYRLGYSTGGFDILYDILSNKLHKSITSLGTIISAIVVLLGGIVFSPVLIMYSIFIIYSTNKIIDSVMIGTSNQMMIYIISTKNNEIKDLILNKFSSGVTEIKIVDNKLFFKKHMLMCIISNTTYSRFKNEIKKIDSDVYMLANQCYEVNGGFIYKVLPF